MQIDAMSKGETGYPDETVRDWVRSLVTSRKTTLTGLARLTDNGVSQSTLSRFMKGETKTLSPQSLQALREISDLVVPQDILRVIDAAPGRVTKALVANRLPQDPDLPVWGVHPLAGETEFRLNPTPLQFLRRPLKLAGMRHAMAFYAPDESMSPRWRQGEPVVVDLSRPATEGGYALVQLKPQDDPDAEEVFMFRQYLGRRAGQLVLGTAESEAEPVRVPLLRLLKTSRVLDWADLIS